MFGVEVVRPCEEKFCSLSPQNLLTSSEHLWVFRRDLNKMHFLKSLSVLLLLIIGILTSTQAMRRGCCLPISRPENTEEKFPPIHDLGTELRYQLLNLESQERGLVLEADRSLHTYYQFRADLQAQLNSRAALQPIIDESWQSHSLASTSLANVRQQIRDVKIELAQLQQPQSHPSGSNHEAQPNGGEG